MHFNQKNNFIKKVTIQTFQKSDFYIENFLATFFLTIGFTKHGHYKHLFGLVKKLELQKTSRNNLILHYWILVANLLIVFYKNYYFYI